MTRGTFKQDKSHLTRKEIINLFASRSWSVSGIHCFTKLIKERTADEQQALVGTIKAVLDSGGIAEPDVVWGGEPDVIIDPGGDEKKNQTKHFVKVYVKWDSEGKELVSG